MESTIFMLVAGLIFFLTFLYFVPVNLWITAVFSGVQIGLMQLVFMKIRKSPVKEIIFALITSHKAGLDISLDQLETHALAGGKVQELIKALIKTKMEKLEISYEELCAQDLAGNDLIKFVKRYKNDSLSGMDGIKRTLCDKIMNHLNDDQVRDVENCISRL